MEHAARLERLLIGLRGLGLLRRWPLGDADEADAQIRVMTEMLHHRDEPPMSDAWALEGFDHAAGYAAWAETYDDPGNALIDVEQAAIGPILEALPPGDAADVACGTGRLAAALCRMGHRVTGVDPSPEMLAVASSKGLPATFVPGSFDRLPLPDESVDLVTCALALTHVSDLGPPIAEMARIVRPGGRVVLSDVHPTATATGGQALFRRTDGTRGVVVNLQHQVSDYIRAFGRCGLTIESCREPLVDDAFKAGLLGSEELRAAADVGLTGLPLLLIWVLRA